MVASHNLGVDGGSADLGEEPLGGDEVVDAPTGILLAGTEAVAPPRVGDVVGVKGAEGVDESAAEQGGELLALFVGESCIAAVGLGVLQVDFLMCHVHVAAHDDGLLCVELLQIGLEVVFPPHAVVEPSESVLGVGCIYAYQIELGHLERYDAPFVVVLVDADAISHAERLVTGKDGSTRIALLVGIVPIRLIALKGQIELSFLHLRLLETEEIGIQLTENLTESLTLASAKPVYIPTDKFHMLKLFWLQSYKK